MSPTATIVLRHGKERSLRRRHPWVFAGAIDRVVGSAEPGATVQVSAADGSFLAWAAYNPASQIAARVWSFDAAATVDADFIAARVHQAAAARADVAACSDAARLVFAESDGLPGVIIDRYASVVVLELTTAGADRWRPALVEACRSLEGVDSIYERSDVDIRGREGLPQRAGLLWGAEPPATVVIGEHGATYGLDVRVGHKTGFYLDQREARRAVAALAPGRRVLNMFGYTGAFSVVATLAGARGVTTVDSSAPALALAADNLRRNGLEATGLVTADAFGELRRLRDVAARFDLIIVDPPKLVQRSHHLDKGARAYKDLNWLAFGLLNPGGILVTFSCSGVLGAELHQKIVADAALDAGREAQIVGRLHQASDHPVLLSFPESQYLKGLVCRVA